MTTFLQLHYLTPYPPSNPNRDDMGRPKSAYVGGAHRLRLSSQSVKRAVRQSDEFRQALRGNIGERTQRIGEVVLQHMLHGGADVKVAHETAEQLASVFGKLDEKKNKEDGVVRIAQLAFVSPDERKLLLELADQVMSGTPLPELKDLKKKILKTADGAVDIAMFGRMLAEDPKFNREAAVQISHAFTTHKALAEDDYFTAVDDLKKPAEDAGAGHVGEHAFGSGLYYLYACVNCDLLLENLDGDVDLAKISTGTLASALATATPSGKQNSHAHHPRAVYIRAEIGCNQPRDLSGAFFKPIERTPWIDNSIEALESMAEKLDAAYGSATESTTCMNILTGEGGIDDIRQFAEGAILKVNS